MLNHLPYVILKIKLFQFFFQVVYKLLVAINSNDFDIFLGSDNKINPVKIQHHHLSLNLIIVLMVFVKYYRISWSFKVKVSRVNRMI